MSAQRRVSTCATRKLQGFAPLPYHTFASAHGTTVGQGRCRAAAAAPRRGRRSTARCRFVKQWVRRRAILAGGRRRRITVRLMVGMVLAALGLMAAPATTAVADPVPPACTPPVQITDVAFGPPEVTAGDASTATLVLKNCSPDPKPVTATWTGRFLGPSHGIPAGCPVIDPLPQQVTLAPYSELHSALTYTVPWDCRALALVVFVHVQQDA